VSVFLLYYFLFSSCLWKDQRRDWSYKDLKFMLLRLIHDYYKYNVKWLILDVLLEIRIYELICYGLRNLFQLCWKIWTEWSWDWKWHNFIMVLDLWKLHFSPWTLKNYYLTNETYFGILSSFLMSLRMMNLSLIIYLYNFQFTLFILEIYSLVPELWKNYNLISGTWIEILNIIEDELWVKF
jgi:hypothetical protein